MLAEDLQTRFLEMADILEIAGENPFKIRAYRRGAELIGSMADELLSEISVKELEKLPGIGMALAEKTVEYRESGKIYELEKLRTGVPPGLLQLLEIPGLGPKTLRLLWLEFQVTSVEDLKKLLATDLLEKRPRFGKKSVDKLRQSIGSFAVQNTRIPYAEARRIADEFLTELRHCPAVEQSEVAGSLRRKKESIGDIDLLVASTRSQEVSAYFLALPQVKNIIAQGSTKSAIVTHADRQVDLRVVPPESFGAALQYFTGSKEHNIILRTIALKKNLHLSEYGVFRGKEKLAGETEQGVYEVLGQKWVEPEKRLGKDELE